MDTPPTPEHESLHVLLAEHPLPPEADLVHHEGSSWTVAEIQQGAARFASALEDAGVRPGDPVAALVTSGAGAVAQMFGTWQIGCPYVPLNTRLGNDELTALLESHPPGVVVVPTDRPLPGTDAWGTIERTDELEWRVVHPSTGTARPYPDDVAVVLRTSGTTGMPKSVFHTHESMVNSIDLMVSNLRGGRSRSNHRVSANLIPVSLALTAGIYNALFALRVGAAVVLLDRFDAPAFADAVTRFEIRSTVLAPAMITMLADDPEVEDLGPLRFVRSITAPLLPDEAHRFHEKFGVAVLNGYGQTELGGEVVGWNAADWRDNKDDKLGSVGRPHHGVEIRIVDPSSGDELGPGESGDIHIRSPYLSDDHPDAGALAGRMVDGFVRTGDLGHLDADGFLWIDGRESDMINRGGLKIMPEEVESTLLQHPSVREVCVAPKPDRRLGEVPVAWIVPAEGDEVDPVELERFGREHLANYKVPVEFRPLGELPRNEIGKVLRNELTERAAEAS